MKKLNIIIAVFLMAMVSGQTFKYGVTGNFHKGSIVGVHDRSLGKYGGSIGVFGQIPLVENDIFDSAYLYLMPQIEYSMQGENSEAEKQTYGKQKFHYDYVAMQVVLKYFFHKGNMKRDFFIFGGPRVEYMVREDRKVNPAYDARFQLVADKNVNKFGYGAAFGVGIKASQKVEAFMKYEYGFSKVYPDRSRNNYNRLLGIGINYYLNDNW